MDLPDPGTLELHRTWTVYLKSNSDEWVKRILYKLYEHIDCKRPVGIFKQRPIRNYRSIQYIYDGEGIIPLWEDHKDLFENGGCWSTIIRGNPWKDVMNEIFMAMVGETQFDEDNVRGLCVVPVSFQHCIVKLWVRRTGQSAAKLEHVMKDLGCCAPRFKAFA